MFGMFILLLLNDFNTDYLITPISRSRVTNSSISAGLRSWRSLGGSGNTRYRISALISNVNYELGIVLQNSAKFSEHVSLPSLTVSAL